MKKLVRFLNNFELHFMVLLMMLFVVNIAAQIFSRVVLNKPLFFTEEISRTAFLWMVFLGLSYATLYDKHIRITFLMMLMPVKVQKAVEIFLHLLAIAIFCWVFKTSLDYLAFSSRMITPALRISKAVYASILPLAAALTIIRSVQKIVLIVKDPRGKGELS